MKKILVLIGLLRFTLILTAQSGEIYEMSSGEFHYQLILKQNKTFIYNQSFSLGSNSSKGKWLLLKDTLFLYDYKTPWAIKQVEERSLDTLKGRICIEVVAAKSNKSNKRKNYVFIDAKKYESTNLNNLDSLNWRVPDFSVWLNKNCVTTLITDSTGRTYFDQNMINTINVLYSDYKVKNIHSNYFVVTLDTYPIWLSPPTLKWSKWTYDSFSVVPIECGQKLDYISLKRRITKP